MAYNKIFGIGLSKTGTTSLARALEILGFRTVHSPRKSYLYEKRRGLPYFSTLEEYRGFTDFPCWAIYKEVDILYPGSKFILTVRNPHDWYVSRKKHYKARLKQDIKLDWDMSKKSMDKLLKHNQEVMGYFKRRKKDLLVLDIAKGEGWDKLCRFLQVQEPSLTFPHLNKSECL